MGCDLAVTILDRDISPEQLAQASVVAGSGARRIYLVSGPRRPESAGRPYFAIWSDEHIDLAALGRELSVRGKVCIAWKSEHGGVAGVLAYADGNEITNASDSGDEYLFTPSRGVEQTFGVSLELTTDARLAYPDLLLDSEVSCFEITPAGGPVVAIPADAVTKLLEDEFDADPVLPVDA
jgi:hypothetical protein